MKTFVLTAIVGTALASAATAAAPIAVTLAASTPLVTYGTPVTLSGTVSRPKAGLPVSIEATECGSAAQVTAALPRTVETGAFSAAVAPTTASSYQAALRRNLSPAVAVGVRPLLELRKVARGRYRARATAGQPLTGKFVLFQRYKKRRKQWKQVKRLPLGAAVPGTTRPAIVSSVAFRAKLPRGTRVRVAISTAQAGPCYAAATSKSLRA
jgi:hypothetical protein